MSCLNQFQLAETPLALAGCDWNSDCNSKKYLMFGNKVTSQAVRESVKVAGISPSEPDPVTVLEFKSSSARQIIDISANRVFQFIRNFHDGLASALRR